MQKQQAEMRGPDGHAKSPDPAFQLNQAQVIKQWAMLSIGRLDRLLAKTLNGGSAATPAAVAESKEGVFKPNSKITDFYAVGLCTS